MSEVKETKERLIESAKKEFLEKGFMKASLREICANAGVTTGALYFFFKNKEDLFGAIVDKPLSELIGFMMEHFSEDREILSSPIFYEHADGDHDEISAKLIHHLYANYDAFMLLLTKSQGSRYEGYVDKIADITDKEYIAIAEIMARQVPGKKVNRYISHWLAHMSTDAFVHMLTHESDEQRAIEYMKDIMNFIVSGWMEMILISADENSNSQD